MKPQKLTCKICGASWTPIRAESRPHQCGYCNSIYWRTGKPAQTKATRIDLGLALLQRRAIPQVPLNQEDIAAWCGCTRSAIYLIEKGALAKLRQSGLLNPEMIAELESLS